MDNKTIYISGKITGLSETQYMRKFNNAEIVLKNKGYKNIINPALVNSNMPISTDYKTYIKMSLEMLDSADAIYMLENWQDSNGAKLEYHYAVAMGKEIIFEKSEEEK